MIHRVLTPEDAAIAAMFADRLWPGHAAGELAQEMKASLQNEETALFLAFAGEKPVGFAQCALRHDYVEGTSTSPVGFLEGVFVEEPYRKNGYARALVEACENWAKEKGCTEFGSDCEIGNTESLRFHLNIGFEEAGRTIWFAKKL